MSTVSLTAALTGLRREAAERSDRQLLDAYAEHVCQGNQYLAAKLRDSPSLTGEALDGPGGNSVPGFSSPFGKLVGAESTFLK